MGIWIEIPNLSCLQHAGSKEYFKKQHTQNGFEAKTILNGSFWSIKKSFTGVLFLDSHPFNYSAVMRPKLSCWKGLCIPVFKWAECMVGTALAERDCKWYRLVWGELGKEAPLVSFSWGSVTRPLDGWRKNTHGESQACTCHLAFSCNLGRSDAGSQFMFQTNGPSFCDQNWLFVFSVDQEVVRQKLPSLKGTKVRDSLGRSGEIRARSWQAPSPHPPTAVMAAVLPPVPWNNWLKS